MSLTEHQLIKKYFTHHAKAYQRDDVILGIGDDCAIVEVPSGQQLVISTDILTEGIHFLKTWSAKHIGHRALAVALSDLAAMAAKPTWVTLGLSMPAADEKWLDEFCQGFFSLAKHYGIQLIGGDTNQGPLFISVQVHGLVNTDLALRRDGAKVGDLIYVTGELGTSAFALQCMQDQHALTQSEQKAVMPALLQPTPKIQAGLQLSAIAHAAIDISDGLIADLNHIISSSHVGAIIYLEKLPINPILKKYLSQSRTYQLALSGGDDYELCFTIAPSQKDNLEQRLRSCQCPFVQIGTIKKETGLQCIDEAGKPYLISKTFGYEHFSHRENES